MDQRADALHRRRMPSRCRDSCKLAAHSRRSITIPRSRYICTGDQLPGRPSLGSWLSYGLGSAQPTDLPSFVVLTAVVDGAQGRLRRSTTGFGESGISCPASHQGVALRSVREIRCCSIESSPGVSEARRRRRQMLDVLEARLNQKKHFERIGDPGNCQRGSHQYEMAYRMQTSVPELTDIFDGNRVGTFTYRLYGPKTRNKPGYVRGELSAGAPDGRTQRALCPDLPPRLGSALQSLPKRPAAAVPRHRPALGRPDPGSSSSAGCSTTPW